MFLFEVLQAENAGLEFPARWNLSLRLFVLPLEMEADWIPMSAAEDEEFRSLAVTIHQPL
jgi:hypothetical protein